MPAVAGALYAPLSEIVPPLAPSWIDHVAFVFEVPVIIATNCIRPEKLTSASRGVSVSVTPPVGFAPDAPALLVAPEEPSGIAGLPALLDDDPHATAEESTSSAVTPPRDSDPNERIAIMQQ